MCKKSRTFAPEYAKMRKWLNDQTPPIMTMRNLDFYDKTYTIHGTEIK